MEYSSQQVRNGTSISKRDTRFVSVEIYCTLQESPLYLEIPKEQ